MYSWCETQGLCNHTRLEHKVSSFQRVLCTSFNGPEGVSLLQRCPHFRGCYELELRPEDVSLLERCPHFRGGCIWSWDLNLFSHRMVSIYSVVPLTSNFCPAPRANVRESLNDPR